MKTFSESQIAEVAHEANRAIQRILGEQVNFPWESTSPDLRASAVDGVSAILDGRVTQPEQSHANWCDFKQAGGWTYGPVKDFAKKEHPDLLPYVLLSEDQKAKDAVFFAIVRGLGGLA